MALTDKFRIDELFKKGSKVERRDSSNRILVQRKDGKEVKPKIVKEEKPFGTSVIKSKKQRPKI